MGDIKVLTTDTISLSIGAGVGMTKWSHNMEKIENAKDNNLNNTTWSTAGKIHGSVSFNLSDLLDLNLSVGYTSLGNPKFDSGNIDISQQIKTNGLNGSISISKDF